MTIGPSVARRTSSYSSAPGNCVEMAPLTDGVAVRHSRRPAAGTVLLAYPEWTRLVGAARTGAGFAFDVKG